MWQADTLSRSGPSTCPASHRILCLQKQKKMCDITHHSEKKRVKDISYLVPLLLLLLDHSNWQLDFIFSFFQVKDSCVSYVNITSHSCHHHHHHHHHYHHYHHHTASSYNTNMNISQHHSLFASLCLPIPIINWVWDSTDRKQAGSECVGSKIKTIGRASLVQLFKIKLD